MPIVIEDFSFNLYNKTMEELKKIAAIASICVILVSGVFFTIESKLPKKTTQKEVVFWSLQMGTFGDYMNPLIVEFEKENPDIKIKWIDVPYSEGEKRTLASILSKTPPDLVNLTPDFSSVLAQKQALEFLDCKKLSAYNKEILNSLMWGGKCYAVPFYATSSLVFYNKGILKKAGISKLPKTYDEMNNLAQEIKKSSGAFVTMPTVTENDTLLKILNKHNVNTPETLVPAKSQKIFDDFKMMYDKDFIPKESITQNHQEALEKYMSGQLAFIQSGANFLNIIKENAPKVYKETGVSNQFVGDTGKYDVSVMNLIIPTRAQHKEEALKFALFLTNKKNQIELAKLTTILPVNNEALGDPYFTVYDDSDTISKARFLSAKQLNNLQPPVRFRRNQKEIIKALNESVQQIMLGKTSTQKELAKTAKIWQKIEDAE